ncbi:MAG TPA: cyclopropane-fatty-acyl-phospholipid synthase family protein [Myxococcales bacterium]|jgi:cyclopropane-fatty-acyl-phospholipid synthase|nr:cyclopropane-fatty-acyl-phospholipid synthase family protein [Myxococcales bacterium]
MGSSKADIAVSYDVSNEFFRLWLDERMNYTSAVFDDPATPGGARGEVVDPEMSLEQAQLNKLRILSDYAHVKPGMTVLDIGCGWGANVEYQALVNKAKAHGITLSEAQCAEILRRAIPGVTASVCSYLDYRPELKFDAIVSICMMEHIVSPLEAREGKSVAAYRNYFRLAHEWTKPGAYFGLQTILRNFVPRDRQDVRDLGWVTYEIFPGGIVPRLEEIIAAVNPYWEVLEVKTRRLHYERTTFLWRERLRKNEAKIRATWGDKVFVDYDRYLSTCVTGFQKHYQSLAQYSLKRID